MSIPFAEGSTSRMVDNSNDADSLNGDDDFHEARSQRADDDDSDDSGLDETADWQDPAGLAVL